MSAADAAPAAAEEAVEECSICHQQCIDAGTPDCCEHLFCCGCIVTWAQQRRAAPTCPMCRAVFTAVRRVADGATVAVEPAPAAAHGLVVVDDAFLVRIAGVTHDGRQDRVRALQPGDAVQLVREPNNAFDPRAVAVLNADGLSLGYVPRALTAPFHERNLVAAVERVGTLVARGPGGEAREVAWAVLCVH